MKRIPLSPILPRVLFFHIPKTGGTSIRHLLRQLTRGTTVDADFQAARYVVNQHSAANSFQGHLTFFPGDFQEITRNYLTTTVLRNPASRIISQYFQYRRASHFEESEYALAAKGLGLIEYLRWLEHRNDFESLNLACYSLATLVTTGDYPISRENALDLALEASRNFDIIGNTDDLEAYARILSARLGSPVADVPYLNQSTQSESDEVSEEALSLAHTLTCLDSELYRAVFGSCNDSVMTRPHVEKDFSRFPIHFQALNFGKGEVSIVEVRAGRLKQGSVENTLSNGETLTIRCTLAAQRSIQDMTLGIGIRTMKGELVFGTNTRLLGGELIIDQQGKYHYTFQLPCMLQVGAYEVHMALHRGSSHHEGCEHWLEPAAHFNVVGCVSASFAGLVNLPVQFSRDPGGTAVI